ncbi:hypothetical protein TGAMA5MH_03217 [Trichoderma gamsii]|uniref:Uncharacterized protein n=1 Tax=Trichoderma gamsii TaxID=398673 RepID=A0A2K0TI02_9HYPO|nr:hypothetical protein TGAMA5MH_03217 [Trichoderma gamsii]
MFLTTLNRAGRTFWCLASPAVRPASMQTSSPVRIRRGSPSRTNGPPIRLSV